MKPREKVGNIMLYVSALVVAIWAGHIIGAWNLDVYVMHVFTIGFSLFVISQILTYKK